jgi:hypothetical protein
MSSFVGCMDKAARRVPGNQCRRFRGPSARGFCDAISLLANERYDRRRPPRPPRFSREPRPPPPRPCRDPLPPSPEPPPRFDRASRFFAIIRPTASSQVGMPRNPCLAGRSSPKSSSSSSTSSAPSSSASTLTPLFSRLASSLDSGSAADSSPSDFSSTTAFASSPTAFFLPRRERRRFGRRSPTSSVSAVSLSDSATTSSSAATTVEVSSVSLVGSAVSDEVVSTASSDAGSRESFRSESRPERRRRRRFLGRFSSDSVSSFSGAGAAAASDDSSRSNGSSKSNRSSKKFGDSSGVSGGGGARLPCLAAEGDDAGAAETGTVGLATGDAGDDATGDGSTFTPRSLASKSQLDATGGDAGRDARGGDFCCGEGGGGTGFDCCGAGSSAGRLTPRLEANESQWFGEFGSGIFVNRFGEIVNTGLVAPPTDGHPLSIVPFSELGKDYWGADKSAVVILTSTQSYRLQAFPFSAGSQEFSLEGILRGRQP